MNKRLLQLFVLFVLAALISANIGIHAVSGATYNWLQFNGNPQHSGNNTSETMISTANVSSLKVLFSVLLDDSLDSSPLYLGGVSTPLGVKDLMFYAGQAGYIEALDAHTGAVIWKHQNGPGTCRVNKTGAACYTTASPAIDPNLNYIYSYGLDGYVHKYQVGNGAEVTGGGWPELATLKDYDEKGSASLSIATARSGTSYLYASSAGYPGDLGDYQGHITAINLSTGAQKVFNAVCSNQAVHFVAAPGTPDCAQVQSAIWGRPGVVYSADTDRIYATTGNAIFDPINHDWGDTVFALNPDGSGSNGNPLDSYTPTNYDVLQGSDLDLGSTSPAILPPIPGSSVAHVAVQSGKDSKLRLINLDNLSGQGAPGHTGGEISSIINVPQGGEVLTQPAVWTNPANGNVWVFVSTRNGISGLKVVVSGGIPALSPVWQNATGGSSPLVANGVLFVAGDYNLRALNPLTGAQLWNDTSIGQVHWASPMVANGVLYMASEPRLLTAWTVNGITNPTPTNTAVGPTATSLPASPTPTATQASGEIVDPASIATLPAGSHVLLDFNNFANPADGQVVPNSYAGLTWSGFVEGSPWAGINSWNIYLTYGSRQATVTFPIAVTVTSLRVSSQASNTVTLSSPGNPDVSASTSGGIPTTLTTGWVNAVTTLTVRTTSDDHALDDLRFTTGGGSGGPTPTQTFTPLPPTATPTPVPPSPTPTATASAGTVIDPANVSVLAAGTNVLLDFNNLTNPADAQPIPNGYGGLTWTNLVEGSPWAGIATWNFYIEFGKGQGTVTFPRPVTLTSLRASSQGSNTITLSSAGNPDVSITTSGNTPGTLSTGWTTNITSLTINTTSDDHALDDLRFTVR